VELLYLDVLLGIFGGIMILYLKTEIKVNDKDSDRCSINCQHIHKVRGNYCCALYGDTEVDTGDDDEIGYGFKRTTQCLCNVIGQPHLGSFAGDL
jgi:hypothetical protein